jgi:hypothetical protein
MKSSYYIFTALIFIAARVYSSIFIRIIVSFLFIVGLHSIFKIFKKTKTQKKRFAVLVGIVPGFFISFAFTPIYDIDYGILDDKLKLETFADLPADSNNSYSHSGGHEIIAFLDVGCAHCKMALEKFNANITAGQVIPIHLFFHNDSTDVNSFLEQNNSKNLTHHYLQSEGQFIVHAGFEFPSIYLINPEGETIYHWVGDDMNYSALDYLLSLP